MIYVLKMNPSKIEVQGNASATSVVGFAGGGGWMHTIHWPSSPANL